MLEQCLCCSGWGEYTRVAVTLPRSTRQASTLVKWVKDSNTADRKSIAQCFSRKFVVLRAFFDPESTLPLKTTAYHLILHEPNEVSLTPSTTYCFLITHVYVILTSTPRTSDCFSSHT